VIDFFDLSKIDN